MKAKAVYCYNTFDLKFPANDTTIKQIIMAILVENFLLLSCVGLWRQITWSGWKFYIYNIYTMIVILMNFGFTLTEVWNNVLIINNTNDIIKNVFSVFAMIVVCAKIFGILESHESIVEICQSLQTDWLKPNTIDEILIEEKYNHTINST
ncbi:hypothetical protein PV327_005182 [Microctonus hyperodae]|uniref:Uncharacterized protein n=1 Tax=Microctonus hyperodae TaxID=165561 RepID=A0AA39G0U9_MICHY|nr:hypothetical protein PV327_005182 [Microctonus hyperodae]